MIFVKNEKIRALLKKATKAVNNDDRQWVFSEVDQEKFAKLIASECAELCADIDGGENMFSRAIREHFEVK